MPLTTDELTSWADEFYGALGIPKTWKGLAHDSGVHFTGLFQMRQRNAIDPSIVLKVARTHGRDPLLAIATFPRYEHLARRARPTAREVLSALPPGLIFTELGCTLLGRTSQGVPADLDWTAWDFRLSSWMSFCGPEDYRAILANLLQMRPSGLSARLNGSSAWPVDEIVSGAGRLGLDPVFGLLLTGHITSDESGMDRSLASEVLKTATKEELIPLAKFSIRFIDQGVPIPPLRAKRDRGDTI